MADLRGGIRPGAGRKPSGKGKVQYWVTPDEAEFLRLKLSEQRGEITIPLSDFEKEIAKLKYDLSLAQAKFDMKVHTLQMAHKDEIENLKSKYEPNQIESKYQPKPLELEIEVPICKKCGTKYQPIPRRDGGTFLGCPNWGNHR